MELSTDCDSQTQEFRVLLFHKMWDQPDRCSKIFKFAPKKRDLNVAVAMQIAAELEIDVTVPNAVWYVGGSIKSYVTGIY